jgi:mono/diheme cytochrome c family protein
VIGYVQTFSMRWEDEDPCDPIPIVKPYYVGNPTSVKRGEEVYKQMKCWECHGDTGKGDGTKSNELKDDYGRKIVPFDFTTGELKRGTSPEAIYITFTSGLDGTGMASFQDSLSEEDRWHLVSYTLKLMGR